MAASWLGFSPLSCWGKGGRKNGPIVFLPWTWKISVLLDLAFTCQTDGGGGKKPISKVQRKRTGFHLNTWNIRDKRTVNMSWNSWEKSLSQMQSEIFTEKGSRPSWTPLLWCVLGYSYVLQTLFRDLKTLCDWLKINLGTFRADCEALLQMGTKAHQPCKVRSKGLF